MRRRTKVGVTLLTAVLLVSLLVGTATPAAALDGPVSSPPGGFSLDDNDPGDGEQWGRVGGRTLRFYNFNLAQFDLLLWGPDGTNAVQIAFDGAVDTLDEILDYQGSLAPGQVAWTGQTQVTLQGTCDGTHTVDTRFLLTVTDSNGAPVTFVPHPLTSLPQVNITSLPANMSTGEVFFTATLQMEAVNPVSCYNDECPPGDPRRVPPQGDPGPALNVFDCLDTPPAAAEDALTEFLHGFSYELATTALTLDQHHAQMTDLVNLLEAKADALAGEFVWWKTDWNNVKVDLLTNQGNMSSAIGALEAKLDYQESLLNDVKNNTDGLGNIAGDIQNLSSDMGQVKNKQDEMAGQIGNLPNRNLLLLLFGVETGEIGMPDDPNLPPGTLGWLKGISDLYLGIDALEAKADVLESKLDILGGGGSSLASQDSVDAIEAKADALESKADTLAANLIAHDTAIETAIDTRATAIDSVLSAIEAKVNALNGATVSSRASQVSVDALEVKADALEGKADAIEAKLDASLNGTVASRASQASVDDLAIALAALEGKADTMAAKLEALNGVSISTRASQESVDALAADLAAHDSDIKAAIDTRATAIDGALGALEAKLDARLDVAVSTRASQVSVDALEAKLDASLDETVSSRASQASVDALGTVVAQQKVDLQVISVKNNERFLLLATQAGQAVAAELTGVQALSVKKNKPAQAHDVTGDATTVAGAEGILDVTVDLPKKVKNVRVLVFTVEYDGVEGTIMVDLHGDDSDD